MFNKKRKRPISNVSKNIPKINEIYIGEIKNIKPYGMFKRLIDFYPNKIDGLLHISELSTNKNLYQYKLYEKIYRR